MNTNSTEFWAAAAALIAALGAAAKKIISRKARPKPEYITRTEFHQEMLSTRDRAAADHIALAQKLDQAQHALAVRLETNHRLLLGALERQRVNFEHRLDRLESTVARLDERTSLRR